MDDIFAIAGSRNKLRCDSYVPLSSEYISDDCNSIVCRKCGEVRRVKKYSTLFGTFIWAKADPEDFCLCSCDRAVLEEKVKKEKHEKFLYLYDCEELRKLIGSEYISATFDRITNAIDSSYRIALEACKNYCRDKTSTVEEGIGIYLYSPNPGVGKSTLMACVRNDFIKDDIPCVYINSSDIIEYARDNGDDIERKFGFSMFTRVPVLIIDDIGAQSLDRNTSYCGWAKDVWYSLMEKRNKDNLCTCFTSNYSPDELMTKQGFDFKTVDRIKERCAHRIYRIDGNSFRGK